MQIIMDYRYDENSHELLPFQPQIDILIFYILIICEISYIFSINQQTLQFRHRQQMIALKNINFAATYVRALKMLKNQKTNEIMNAGTRKNITFSFANQKKQTVSSTKKQKFRDKFINDYVYYKLVPKSVRSQQLQRIMNKTPSNDMFQGQFASFPIQQDFIHNQKKLKVYRWQPQRKRPKAVVIVHHSLNGHTNMYGNLAKNLAKKGYLVTGIDLPNFGKSQGDSRGCIETFKSVAFPCEQFFHSIKKQYPNTKIYVLGNSLGGSIAFYLSTSYSNQITGTILLSPALRQNPMHHPLIKKIILITSFLLPSFKFWKASARNGTKKKLTKYLQKDQFIYKGGMWTSTTSSILVAMNIISKQFKQLKTPYLIVQSGQDKLIDPFMAIDLQKQSPSPSKTTVIIRDMWHNVLFDDHRNDVNKIVEQWLQQQNTYQ